MPDLITKLIVPAAGFAALAFPAIMASAQPGSTGDQCFAKRNIEGFQAPDNRTVYIRVGVSDVYKLDLMFDCTGLAFRQGFGLESTPGDPWICKPIQATVIYREGGIAMRCPVSAIHKLSPAELDALPKRDRP